MKYEEKMAQLAFGIAERDRIEQDYQRKLEASPKDKQLQKRYKNWIKSGRPVFVKLAESKYSKKIREMHERKKGLAKQLKGE